MRHPQILALAIIIGLSACAIPVTTPGREPADGQPGYKVQQYVSFLQTVNMRERINAERLKQNMPAVQLDSNLSYVAENHARDMVQREYFGDTAPAGTIKLTTGHVISFEAAKTWAYLLRVLSAGKVWAPQTWAEVFQRAVPEEPQATIGSRVLSDDPDGWLVNTRDLARINNPALTRLGIGFAYNPKLKVYYAVMYMTDGVSAPHQLHRPRR